MCLARSLPRFAGAKVRLFLELAKLFASFLRYSCRKFSYLDFHQALATYTHYYLYTSFVDEYTEHNDIKQQQADSAEDRPGRWIIEHQQGSGNGQRHQ